MRNTLPPLRRDLHFNLSYLGLAHLTENYTLRVRGRAHPMRRHTRETLAAQGFPAKRGGECPTHFAEAVETDPNTVQLMFVHGPLAANGFPTLAALVVNTANSNNHYTCDDVARALIFMNPTVTMLTPGAADTVLAHIGGTDALPGLRQSIMAAGESWCSPLPVLDDNGHPVLKPDGTPYYTYALHPGVLNSTAPVSGQSKAAIYSDAALQGTRWNLSPGVSHLDLSPEASGVGIHGQGTASAGGYSINLQDGGPNFGLSVKVNALDNENDELVLDLTVTNSYIRHTSVFVSFLKADGVTAMTVPDELWITLARGAMLTLIQNWLAVADSQAGQELLSLLGNKEGTLKWCGNVGAESTFLGIPVSSTNINFRFALPSNQGAVGKIRLLVGSLGTYSHNDWDPTAAWLGLALTALIDLAIPTYALVTTAGEESNTLFDSLFKSPGFLLPTAYSVYLIAKDIFTDSANLDDDLSSALIAFADSLVSRVLTSSEVAAALAGFFAAEEAEEAIPIVGWALKVLALEATAEQLAQTVGEVIGSPRVVEFDLTVTMDACITLLPDVSTGNEFPQTASYFTVTAQYTGNTTRTYTGDIADPKVSSLSINWPQVPVGGMVSFVVALFDSNGWGVGKGISPTVPNLINHNGVFAIDVVVQQLLYPLGPGTTYLHSHLLAYADENGRSGYLWQDVKQAPSETVSNLGTGPTGHVLQALNGITLSDDLGILGYSWEASGLGIPPVNDDSPETELYSLQNIGFKPIQHDADTFWPQAGYMTAPAGYPKAPLLLYLRTKPDSGPDVASPGFFFLDPSGDKKHGFHLRQVKPVTDPTIDINDPSRRFDLATGTSWGRFSFLPTSLAIHSNGYVAAVHPRYNMMQILHLSDQPLSDAEAPRAYTPIGVGTAPGRLKSPALVAITPQQTILVLEAGNQRIQAFSRGGHPVPAFPKSATPFWIPLAQHAASSENVVYLSMSVDVAGYVFVLSQNNNGYDPNDFNLDIYTPTGQHLVYQQGLVAAGLAVDLWRNIYTLNYQQISGPKGRTEPSVSEYIPSTPKPAL